MTFQTLGNRQNPAVMLIHGMISSGADCEPFGRCLADEYYVILPTLDGHGNDGTDLLPLEGEVDRLVGYLKENDIHFDTGPKNDNVRVFCPWVSSNSLPVRTGR